MQGEQELSDQSDRLSATVLCGSCETPGAPPVPVYGLQIVTADHCWRWPDLDEERERVASLARRLEALSPEPCHLEDIIRDFVLERYLP